MSQPLSALAGIVVLLLLGCAAGHHPAPQAAPSGAEGARIQFARWVVGVREPVIRYVEPGAADPSVADEIRQAGHLAGALRGTQLFAQVDFTRQLACAPDLELAVRVRPGDPMRLTSSWYAPLTLSGAILEQDEGVSFTPAEQPAEVFDFPYPTQFVVGILPLLASPALVTGAVPTWSLMGTGDANHELAIYLLSNADRLTAFARPRAEGCPAAPRAP
jgi:hypothetical protein